MPKNSMGALKFRLYGVLFIMIGMQYPLSHKNRVVIPVNRAARGRQSLMLDKNIPLVSPQVRFECHSLKPKIWLNDLLSE